MSTVWTRADGGRGEHLQLLVSPLAHDASLERLPMLEVSWGGRCADALRALASFKSDGGGQLPYAWLRARLEYDLAPLSWIERALSLGPAAPGQPTLPLLRIEQDLDPAAQRDRLRERIIGALRHWIPTHVQPFAEHIGRTQLAVALSASIDDADALRIDEVETEIWPQGHRARIPDLARWVGQVLHGSALFDGLGDCRLVSRAQYPSNAVELMTPPILTKNGAFSMVARVSVQTMPLSDALLIKAAPARRLWMAKVPRAPWTVRRTQGYFLPSDRRPWMSFDVLNTGDGWKLGDDYWAMAFDDPSMPMSLSDIVQRPAVEGQFWCGFGYHTMFGSHGVARATFEVDEIDLARKVGAALEGYLGPPLPWRECKLVRRAKPKLRALRLSDFSVESAIDEAGNDDSEDDAGTEQHTAALDVQLQMRRDAILAMHGGQAPLLWVIAREPRDRELLSQAARSLYGDAVEIVTEDLPASTHGLRHDLPGRELKGAARLQARIGAWAPLQALLGQRDGPQYVLICARQSYGKKDEDPVNYFAGTAAMCTAGANVHYVLPPDGEDPKVLGDFITRASSALLDLMFGHNGYLHGVDEFLARHFEPSSLPGGIYGLQVVSATGAQRSGQRPVAVLAVTKLVPGDARCWVRFGWLGERGPCLGNWTPLRDGLRWVASQRTLSLGSGEARSQTVQTLVADAMTQLHRDDPHALVMVDWSTFAGIWRQLSDVALQSGAVGLASRRDIRGSFQGLRMVRIRRGDPSPAVRTVKRVDYAGHHSGDSPSSWQSTGEVANEIYATTQAALLDLGGNDRQRHFVGTHGYGGVPNKAPRGLSAYREMRRARPLKDPQTKALAHHPLTEQPLFEFVSWPPAYDLDQGPPSPIEITILLSAAGDDPARIASAVMGLRSGYAHYGSWTGLPAPLFFRRKIADYFVQYSGVDPTDPERDEPPALPVPTPPVSAAAAEDLPDDNGADEPAAPWEEPDDGASLGLGARLQPEVGQLAARLVGAPLSIEQITAARPYALHASSVPLSSSMLGAPTPVDPDVGSNYSLLMSHRALYRDRILNGDVRLPIPEFVTLETVARHCDPLPSDLRKAWKQMHQKRLVPMGTPLKTPSVVQFQVWLFEHLDRPQLLAALLACHPGPRPFWAVGFHQRGATLAQQIFKMASLPNATKEQTALIARALIAGEHWDDLTWGMFCAAQLGWPVMSAVLARETASIDNEAVRQARDYIGACVITVHAVALPTSPAPPPGHLPAAVATASAPSSSSTTPAATPPAGTDVPEPDMSEARDSIGSTPWTLPLQRLRDQTLALCTERRPSGEELDLLAQSIVELREAVSADEARELRAHSEQQDWAATRKRAQELCALLSHPLVHRRIGPLSVAEGAVAIPRAEAEAKLLASERHMRDHSAAYEALQRLTSGMMMDLSDPGQRQAYEDGITSLERLKTSVEELIDAGLLRRAAAAGDPERPAEVRPVADAPAPTTTESAPGDNDGDEAAATVISAPANDQPAAAIVSADEADADCTAPAPRAAVEEQAGETQVGSTAVTDMPVTEQDDDSGQQTAADAQPQDETLSEDVDPLRVASALQTFIERRDLALANLLARRRSRTELDLDCRFEVFAVDGVRMVARAGAGYEQAEKALPWLLEQDLQWDSDDEGAQARVLAVLAGLIGPALFSTGSREPLATFAAILQKSFERALPLHELTEFIASLQVQPFSLTPESLCRSIIGTEVRARTTWEQLVDKAKGWLTSGAVKRTWPHQAMAKIHKELFSEKHPIGAALKALAAGKPDNATRRALAEGLASGPNPHSIVHAVARRLREDRKTPGPLVLRMERDVEATLELLRSATVMLEHQQITPAGADHLKSSVCQQLLARLRDAHAYLQEMALEYPGHEAMRHCALMVIQGLVDWFEAPPERYPGMIPEEQMALVPLLLDATLEPMASIGEGTVAAALIGLAEQEPMKREDRLALALEEHRENGRHFAVAAVQAMLRIDPDSADRKALEEARAQLLERVELARRRIAMAEALNVIQSDAARTLERLVLAIQSSAPDIGRYPATSLQYPDFGFAIERLSRHVEAELDLLEVRGRERFLSDVENETSAIPTHLQSRLPRVRELASKGMSELMTAREMFRGLKKGQDLSEEPYRNVELHDFVERFIPALDSVCVGDAVKDVLELLESRDEHPLLSEIAGRYDETIEALRAWERCCDESLRVADRGTVLKRLLAAFELRDYELEARPSAQGVATFTLTGRLFSGVRPFVPPEFGSAPRLDLHVIPARKATTTQIQGLIGVATAYGLAFMRGRLSPATRATLAADNRGHSRLILVDDYLVLYLLLSADRRPSRLMQAGLSTCMCEPYADVSPVRQEMFRGRLAMLSELRNLSGGRVMFGGRRLGKTSVIDAVERSVRDDRRPGEFAVRVDLTRIDRNNHRVDCWNEIAKALVAAKFMPAVSGSGKASPEQVMKGLRNAMSKRDTTLLLMLDESDNAMEADAENQAFVNDLHGLTESLGHTRFRFLLAGLHNVQRMLRTPNSVLRKMGKPFEVKPFIEDADREAGIALITEPFAALGFEFETIELPFQILALTHFYPALVQEYCSALLKRMYKLRGGQPAPFTITWQHVCQMESDTTLLNTLRMKFDANLDLDKRYMAIAYIFAYRQYDAAERTDVSGGDASMSRAQVRADCETFAPGLFAGSEDHVYDCLLDEMINLNLLERAGASRYILAAPNIAYMLGSREGIEERLMRMIDETGGHQLDPLAAHPRLGGRDEAFPLSFGMLRNCTEDEVRPITVLVAPAAAGLSRIRNMAGSLDGTDLFIRYHTQQLQDSTFTQLQRTADARPEQIVIHVFGPGHWQPAQLPRLVRRMEDLVRHRIRVWLLADPLGIGLEFAQKEECGHTPRGVRVESVPPWSKQAIEAFAKETCVGMRGDSEQVAQAVLSVTGGHGDWVQRVTQLCKDTRDHREIASRAKQALFGAGTDAILQEMGLTRDLYELLEAVADKNLSLRDAFSVAQARGHGEHAITYLRWMGGFKLSESGHLAMNEAIYEIV